MKKIYHFYDVRLVSYKRLFFDSKEKAEKFYEDYIDINGIVLSTGNYDDIGIEEILVL